MVTGATEFDRVANSLRKAINRRGFCPNVGIDLVTLAAMLGHSRIQMVLRYTHPNREHQTQAMEQIERFSDDAMKARKGAKCK